MSTRRPRLDLLRGGELGSWGERVVTCISPSPRQGTTWGLGGTCVNVGCIPKKMMHYASLLGEGFSDARSMGWKLVGATFGLGGFPARPADPRPPPSPQPQDDELRKSFDWNELVNSVQNHIGSLNFGYRVQLRSKNVNYINAKGSFADPHTVIARKKNGQEQLITGGACAPGVALVGCSEEDPPLTAPR